MIVITSYSIHYTKLYENIHASITPDNTRKVTQALAVFERYVDMQELSDKIIKTKTKIVTPKMFEAQLIQRAKMNKQHIVLPSYNFV